MQQKYSATKIEILAIVETQKEFMGMLWGQYVKSSPTMRISQETP